MYIYIFDLLCCDLLCLSIGIGNKKKHQSHQSSLLYDDKTIQDHEKKVYRLFKAIRTAINRPYEQQDHHRQLLFDIYDAKNSSSIHHDHHHSYLNDSSIGSNDNENSHNFTGTTTTTTVIVVTSSRFYNNNNYNYLIIIYYCYHECTCIYISSIFYVVICSVCLLE